MSHMFVICFSCHHIVFGLSLCLKRVRYILNVYRANFLPNREPYGSPMGLGVGVYFHTYGDSRSLITLTHVGHASRTLLVHRISSYVYSATSYYRMRPSLGSTNRLVLIDLGVVPRPACTRSDQATVIAANVATTFRL